MAYTSDWVSLHVNNWKAVLAPLAAKMGARGLEIGTFEGRSAAWFLDNILTAPHSHLTCVDPRPAQVFEENMARFGLRYSLVKEASFTYLRREDLGIFDFIYVDGEHSSPFVLEDLVLSMRALRCDGVLIVDDYTWESTNSDDPRTTPRLGIDFFLEVYRNEFDVLHKGMQVIARKLRDPQPDRDEAELLEGIKEGVILPTY